MKTIEEVLAWITNKEKYFKGHMPKRGITGLVEREAQESLLKELKEAITKESSQ